VSISNWLRGATAVAVSIMALAACGTANEPQGEEPGAEARDADAHEIRIAYLAVASWLPAMVAEEEGFFAAEGLSVESEIITNLATLPGTMGQQFDIASTTVPDVLNAQESGVNVEVVAGEAWETQDNSIVRLLARPGSGVEGIGDVEGQRLAAGTLGGNIHPATLYWLAQEEVDVSTITISEVPFPQQSAQIEAGTVDVVQALEPFASGMIRDGAVDLGSPLLAVGERMSISSWMADSSWAADNRDVIDAFVAALERAKQFIEENEDEARSILQNVADMPEGVASTVKFPDFAFDLSEEDLERWQEVMDVVARS